MVDQLAAGRDDPEEFVKLSKEYAELTPICGVIENYRRCSAEIAFCTEILQDPESDPELNEMAGTALAEMKEKLPQLERQINILLLPKDEADEKDAILEIRAGTGGEEAALF